MCPRRARRVTVECTLACTSHRLLSGFNPLAIPSRLVGAQTLKPSDPRVLCIPCTTQAGLFFRASRCTKIILPLLRCRCFSPSSVSAVDLLLRGPWCCALRCREPTSPNGGTTVADGSASQTVTLDREKGPAGARAGKESRRGDPNQLGGNRRRGNGRCDPIVRA